MSQMRSIGTCGKKVYKSKDSQEDVQIVENKSDEDKSEEDLLFTTSCVITNESSKDWIIDSGCTNHITHDREIFKELNKSNISKVRIGNGEQLVVKGTGTISIKTHSGIKLIFDALYVSEITHNLLSVAQLLEKGYKVSFENKVCVIKNANNIEVFKIHIKDKIFVLDFMKEEFATNIVSMKEGSKLEDKYIWKKVDGGSHSNIHKRSNANAMKSTPNKEKEDDVDIRRNMKDDAKLKKDVMPWKKEKNKYCKHKKRRK